MLMKKIFTFIAAALFAVGASAQETVVLSWDEEPTLSSKTTDDMTNTGSSDNVATWSNGYSIMIMRSDKGQSSAKSITIDGTEYKTIKVSNGAQNKLMLPEGKVTKKITLYSYVNFADGPTASNYRTSYWKEVAGTAYTEDGAFAAFTEDLATPDKREFTFPAANEVTFTNTGEQCCYVMFVEVEDGTPEVGGGEVATGARTWDFTNWSAATIANLKADAAASKVSGWSDVEKQADADADGEPTDLSKDNCFWAASDMTPNADGELLANGQVIEELKGLKFTGDLTTRNLAIAVNYPEIDGMGTYHGGAYLWLGGKNKKFFTIPAVAGGSTIKMGVESHKDSDARGVDLLVNGSSIGQFTPTLYAENTWTIPAGEAVDVVVDNTNGCHIYFIEVADATSIQEVVKVINNGVVYNLAGQKVDENYKGVVIKNGKKMLQK